MKMDADIIFEENEGLVFFSPSAALLIFISRRIAKELIIFGHIYQAKWMILRS